jgi:Family of unknown function (DUF5715)
MRRRWVCIAMLQGLLLSCALLAAPRHSHAHRVPAAHSRTAAPASAHGAKSASTRNRAGVSTVSHSTSRTTPADTEAAQQTAQPVVTALVDPVPRGHFPAPPPMKGSHESLVRQNVRSEEEGLTRVQDDAQLLAMRRAGDLVALPGSVTLSIDARLPANRRFCRPWTAQFLSDLSRVHYGRFHRALQVNSAVRTVEYQRHLELVNGNAAPAEGEDASPHLTGATIDIAKKGLSTGEIDWMRAYLGPLQAAGKLDVEEEFYQACFHITVYRSYRPEALEPEARLMEAHAVPPVRQSSATKESSATKARSKAAAHHTGSAALLAARVR